jgi:O-antigen/teichoic acid export membrane protein
MGIIIRQSLSNLIIIYTGLSIGYLSTIILSPLVLTEEQIGLLRVLINVSLMFSTFAALGALNIPSRFFPFFNDINKQHNGFLFFLILLGVVGFITFTIFFIALKDIISSFYIKQSPLLIDYYYYFIPLTFFMLFYNIFQIYIIQNQKTVVTNFIREIVIRLLIIMALLLYFINWINFHLMVQLYIIIYGIALISLGFYLKSQKLLFLKPILTIFKSKLIKDIYIYGGFALFGGASGIFIANIDGIMLSAISGLGATGIYTIAFLIATLVEIPKRSISQSVIALISEANKNNNFALLDKIYKKTSITQLIMGTLIFLLIWCNIDNLFMIIPNGQIYAEGKWVVFFIGLAKLFDLATGSNYEILSTSKYYKIDLIFVMILGILAIITNLIFIPIYGITGAALASAISVLIFNTFRYLFILIKMNLQPFTLNNFKELLIILLTFIISYIIPEQINFIIDILIRSLVIMITFIGLTLYFKISDDFNQLFNNLIIKMKSFTFWI